MVTNRIQSAMFPTAHSPTGGRYLECWICRLGGAMSVPLTQDKVNKCHYTRRGVGCTKGLMRHNLQKVQHIVSLVHLAYMATV